MNLDLSSKDRRLEFNLHTPETAGGDGGCGRNGRGQFWLGGDLDEDGGGATLEHSDGLEQLEAVEEDGVRKSGRYDDLLVPVSCLEGVVEGRRTRRSITHLCRLEISQRGVARGEVKGRMWEVVDKVGGVTSGGTLLAHLEKGVVERRGGGGGGGGRGVLARLDETLKHSVSPSISEEVLQFPLMVGAGEMRHDATEEGEEGRREGGRERS